jgi:hypothetical protein
MQSNSGLLRWLKVPFFYNLFQDAIGGNALRRTVLQRHVRAKAGSVRIARREPTLKRFFYFAFCRLYLFS